MAFDYSLHSFRVWNRQWPAAGVKTGHSESANWGVGRGIYRYR